LSNLSISYSASLFAPPSFSPQSTPPIGLRRVIRVAILPTVNAVIYSPKNIYTLLGSMVGIFTGFVAAGGIAISLIWTQVGPKVPDDSNTELNAI
jgi:hypothetical protein